MKQANKQKDTGNEKNFYPKMRELNLPSFPIRISGTPEKPLVFDKLRKKHVALTPEEWVRQHFVNYLIEYKAYPASLIANEVLLQIGCKQLRADTILYDKTLSAKMIIEYKAPDIAITDKVFQQISAYNTILHVDYLTVSNGLQHYCCKMDYTNKKYLFLNDIPRYEDI